MTRPKIYLHCTVCGAELEYGMRHKVTVCTERDEVCENRLTGEPYTRSVWESGRVDYLCDWCHARVMAALAERRTTVDEYIFEVRDGRGPEERRERVVRCRDCRWYRTGNLSGTPVCMRLFELVEIDEPVSARVSPDGFCWHGQERDADGRG